MPACLMTIDDYRLNCCFYLPLHNKPRVAVMMMMMLTTMTNDANDDDNDDADVDGVY